jgi:CBS domain-containing protein
MASIRELMTEDLVTLPASASLQEASELMKARDIGDVIVIEGEDMAGILTDRDIVIRGVAEGQVPSETQVGEILSQDLTTVSPDDPVERAVELMREQALRRLPVVEQGKPVGIVSIGDLAKQQDPSSALADISKAEPNR